MLKFYIISSLIITALAFITEMRRFNKNVKKFIENQAKSTEKKTLTQNLFSYVKVILLSWIPVVNIFFGVVYIYLLFASDYTIIKILDEQQRKEECKKKEIEKLLNQSK